MKHIAISVLCALLCAACAKVSAPVGGPKDVTPPKMVAEQPTSGHCNFKEKQIKITFDEYFTLNNPNANVLISPPLETQPEYILRDKSLLIRFQDSLRPNTTYNMVFSDCIQDYHEGNKLNYFHYCFSTGPEIDNAMIQGKVADAKTAATEQGLFVMLYRGDEDSLPCTTLPDYVTKTDKDGSFRFSNITPGDYRIFALKDINANLMYDLPEETVAFANQRVTAFDAPAKDSIGMLPGLDSLPKVALNSFVSGGLAPKLMHYENPAAGVYKFPYKNAFNRFSVSTPYQSIDYYQTINATSDTVTWYLKDLQQDTFTVVLNADNQIDTVFVKPIKPKATRGETPVARRLSVTAIDAGHFYRPMSLQFSYPVKPADSFPIYVIQFKDTTKFAGSVADTLTLSLPILSKGLANSTVLIPDSVFFGYNGLTNDTLRFSVKAKIEKDYGKLIMDYILPDDTAIYVAELWSGSNCVVQRVLHSSSRLEYGALEPGSYKLSIFRDENGNGRWDSGDYHQKRQPEPMYWFPSDIRIRAFWDDEEQFDITK